MNRRNDELAISECKGVLRHSWYPSTTDAKPDFGVYIANRCERCGTERLMKVTSHGVRISGWRYIYKDRGLYKSITAASMDDWRAEYLARLGIGGRKSKR